jgi:transposase
MEANMARQKRKRRRFTPEYKSKVVELVRSSGKSVGQVARELDLTWTAVRARVQQAAIDAGKGPKRALTTLEREEHRQLRQEVKTLRMEREILKKATVFFAKHGS